MIIASICPKCLGWPLRHDEDDPPPECEYCGVLMTQTDDVGLPVSVRECLVDILRIAEWLRSGDSLNPEAELETIEECAKEALAFLNESPGEPGESRLVPDPELPS